jgi:hypothetical protein
MGSRVNSSEKEISCKIQWDYPDLVIGGIVFIIVVKGAIRMLKLGK